MKILANSLRFLILLSVRAYQKFISPFIAPRCRFYPTCSVYAQQSFQQLGLLKALAYVMKRILKCHPWHPGGYDPPNLT